MLGQFTYDLAEVGRWPAAARAAIKAGVVQKEEVEEVRKGEGGGVELRKRHYKIRDPKGKRMSVEEEMAVLKPFLPPVSSEILWTRCNDRYWRTWLLPGHECAYRLLKRHQVRKATEEALGIQL